MEKPIPVPEEKDLPYWDGAKAGKLVMPRCDECGRITQRLELICRRCHGERFTWTELSGRGTIYSFTVARQATTSGFEEDVPYVMVAVSIEECPEVAIVTNLIGDYDIDTLDLGLPVVVDFESRGEMQIPQFKLAAPQTKVNA